MKTTLLTLAALGLATAANAQLLNYGFESGDVLPGALETVNWEAYAEGSTFTFEDADAYEGVNALGVTTDVTANPWERVIAFKQIPVEPMKSYRVTMMAKGDAPINVGILEGDWYRDIALQTPAGAQTYNLQPGQGSYQRISQVFWSPSYESMCAAYNNAEYPELLQEYFLRLSFTGVGSFKVDNVMIEESTIAGIVFNGDALCVDFGYATNGADLAAAAGGTAVFDPSCVTVTANGEPVVVETVEIKKDGQLYIFLTEDFWLTEEEVSVSFNGIEGFCYAGQVAPMCYEEPNAAVLPFEAEAAMFDDAFAASSLAWEEAELVSSDPADESFELDPTVDTFAFTYNKAVLTSYDGDPAVASLVGGNVDEQLVLVEAEEAAATIVFKRAEGSEPLAKGQYTITVENVYNEKGVVKGTPDVITIEVGKVTVAETTYTACDDVPGTFTVEDNNIPEGWSLVITKTETDEDGNQVQVEDVRLPQEGGYSGTSRAFAFTNSTVAGALYMRDWEGPICGIFGNQEGHALELPAGDVEVRFISAGWGEAGQTVRYSFTEVETGEVALEQTVMIQCSVGKSKNGAEFQKDAFRVNLKGGQYIFKAQLTGGNEILVGGFEVYTYTETEGEKSEAETILKETWSTTPNNAAPVAGSGWRIYAGGEPKNPGQDYNYNGARIFDLSYKNLTKAFYNGMAGAAGTDYIIYGEGEPYVDAEGNVTDEPVLKLSAGKIQVTYYCTNWKTNLQHQTFDLIEKATGDIVYTRTDDITPNPGGDRNAQIEAQKVQFSYYVANPGEYLLKFYTDGEGFVGNLNIETVGSLAVQYKNLLKAAVVAAQEELNTALENDDYAGATRDALAQAIADYTNPDFHTVAEYNAAIAHLEQLVKAMAARRANINGYTNSLQTVIDAVANAAGTKFEGLECYAKAAELVEKYADVKASDLDDEELATCVAEIKLNGALLNNMVNDIVPNLLTKQIANLAAQIVNLDATQEEAEAVIAAGNAISDDQALVKGLKLLLTGKIYEQIGAGNDLFNEYDPEFPDVITPDSLEVALIQNPMFYTNIIADGTNYEGNAESFPGWDIDIKACNVMGEFGWVGNDGVKFNTNHPYTDALVATTWGDCDITVSQALTEMPVGQYTLVLATMDRSYVNQDADGQWVATTGETTSCVFTQQPDAEQRDEKIFNIANIGQYYGMSDTYMCEVPVAAGDDLTGSLLIGAQMTTHGGTFASIDNARLYLTGAAEGFDYAAAAQSVLELAGQGIQLQQRDDQPAVSLFFDLNGRQISAAEGVCIRIDRYADGYTEVRKVVVK